MKKDKFGIDLRFYAVMAFCLAALGQMLLCGLLVGALVFLVQEEWAARQGMQAFFVSIFSTVVSAIFGVFAIFGAIPFLGGVITTFMSAISGLINIIPLVFAIIGIVKTAKGNEANLPLLSKWARKAYGITEQKVYNYANGQNNTQ